MPAGSTAAFTQEIDVGITSGVAAERLAAVGANALPEAKPTPWWRRVLSQLQNPIIYILMFAVAVAVAAVPEGLPAVLTITAPGMRTMLGLVPLDRVVLGLVAAALGVTVIGEEIWSRRVISQKAIS